MAETSIEEIQQQEMSRMFEGFARARVLLLPLPVLVVGYIAATDPSLWRRLLLATVAVAAPVMAGRELWRYQRLGLRRIRYQRTFAVAAVGFVFMCAGTGGLESPFIAGLMPLSIIFGMLFSRQVHRVAFLAVYVTTVWAMALTATHGWIADLVPRLFGGGARAGHNDALLLLQATLYTVVLTGAFFLTRQLRIRFDALVQRTREARADALQAHADQAQLFTALSAEIAHELKNPLASIKGLAALVAPEQQGKNAERLTVMRREIERMQTILDEFLNFSRPLGPLTREPVDLVELCRAVADLHEGLAREAGLSLVVRALGEVNAPCDARKVKQIVINLLQNAIEASTPGGAIELEVQSGALIRVLDRGSGLSPAGAGRMFEAGATTKPTGSGLGLTVARGLARQHGGEIALRNRDGGGCVAELTLPST